MTSSGVNQYAKVKDLTGLGKRGLATPPSLTNWQNHKLDLRN